MSVTTLLVVGDGISFLSLLFLAFWELFVVTSLLDLKQDLISAKDMCDRVNKYFSTFYIMHFLTAFIILLDGKWVQFLFQIPLIVITVRRIISKDIFLNYLSIRRTDELDASFRLHCFYIGYYGIGFLFAFVLFVSCSVSSSSIISFQVSPRSHQTDRRQIIFCRPISTPPSLPISVFFCFSII